MINTAVVLQILGWALLGGVLASLSAWLYITRQIWRQVMRPPGSDMSVATFWRLSLMNLFSVGQLRFFLITATISALIAFAFLVVVKIEAVGS